MTDTHDSSAQTAADTTNSTCLQCHHTFQSPSKLKKHQVDTKNPCQHVVKHHTCEHCHQSFESEKGMQRHLQRKQDVCVLIQELKATHKKELDQVHQEKAVHKEELGKVQQDLALAATTVLDLQNRLKAATSTPEAVFEAAERRLMQKLTDIEQKVTNVGKSCGDIKAAMCQETHVHTALTPSCMILARGASETVSKDQTFSQQQRALCKQASKEQLRYEAAESCELSTAAGDATIDVKDFSCLIYVPGVDGHSDPKPDQRRHFEDSAETARAQQTAHGQVAFEDATDAKLSLSTECRTERLASTTRSHRQSLCAQFPYKFKQEDCDWTNHDCKKVMKMLGIKRCKKEPWLPDNCVFVNLLKDIHCNKDSPQNWNILLPSIDSPIVWVSNGEAFNKEATGRMMYQLIGQLALHLGSLQDKLHEGMVTDVMGDIEGYTDYYRLLEDIANAESCEGFESEFNALSMHIKDVLYKHFLFIEGHKLIEGH